MKGECRHNKVISQLGPVLPRMQSLVLEPTTHYTGPGSRQSSPTNLTRLSHAPNLSVHREPDVLSTYMPSQLRCAGVGVCSSHHDTTASSLAL
jgi:hypothetical protein